MPARAPRVRVAKFGSRNLPMGFTYFMSFTIILLRVYQPPPVLRVFLAVPPYRPVVRGPPPSPPTRPAAGAGGGPHRTRVRLSPATARFSRARLRSGGGTVFTCAPPVDLANPGLGRASAPPSIPAAWHYADAFYVPLVAEAGGSGGDGGPSLARGQVAPAGDVGPLVGAPRPQQGLPSLEGCLVPLFTWL